MHYWQPPESPALRAEGTGHRSLVALLNRVSMLGRGRSTRGANVGTLVKDRKWKDGIRKIPGPTIALFSKFQPLVPSVKSWSPSPETEHTARINCDQGIFLGWMECIGTVMAAVVSDR